MSTGKQDELTDLMLQRGVAYTFVPQIREVEGGKWKANYPAASWSVVGNSRDDAQTLLYQAALNRRGKEDEDGWQIAAVREHLARGPVPGVYEIPLDVNEDIMRSTNPHAALDAVIKQIDDERAKAG